MSNTDTIDTTDWLATRDDLHQLREDHKANIVVVTAMSVGAIALFGQAHGASGFLYSVAVVFVVTVGVVRLYREVMARVTKRHAPLAEVIADKISHDLTVVELSTLIATDRVVVGKTLVRANSSKGNVTVTEQEYRFHDDTEHVGDARARAEVRSSYHKTFT